MSSLSESRRPEAPSQAGVFRSIACGVDGTRAGFEAVRQAAILTPDGAVLRLLAVAWETGTEASAMVKLSRHRAAAALDRARLLAHELGVRAEGTLVEGPHAGVKLLAAAGGDDLLVVGSSGRSHAGGIVLGHAAAEVLHDAPVSVLVARRARAGEFPASILLAVDDRAASRDAAEVAGNLALRHDAVVTVLAGRGSDPATHHAVAETGAAIAAITGVEPVVVDAHGRFHAAAAHVAAELGATLIVTAGVHAERVAECARCSVLLLR
jgi:nucleotide-binding universal stress UspA family protein